MNRTNKGMPWRPPSSPLGQAGFTLIEVLVAIIVFSFGLLGMAGLQAAAMQASRESLAQSQATAFARELAEMMRGNKNIAIKSAASANPYLGEFAVDAVGLGTPSYCLSVANAAEGCTSTADIASAQMTDWLARVDAALPGARVTICFDGTPYDSNGMPQWRCNPTGADEIIFIKIGWTRGSTNRSRPGADAFETASDTASRPGLVLPVTGGNSI